MRLAIQTAHRIFFYHQGGNMKNILSLASLFALASLQASAATFIVPSPDGTAGVRHINNEEQVNKHEITPPGGLYFTFAHGPNSTYAIFKMAAGKARSVPFSINRHNEEAGTIIKGSVLFKAGYNGEFVRVLRAGETIIVPKCVPHSGVFGWDANEETIIVTTFIGKYSEYGEEGAKKVSTELKDKIKAEEVVATKECQEMQGTPPITWTVKDIPHP
jgi:mannose-6-phosphate isomerase-like protein (cupin superfamily)